MRCAAITIARWASAIAVAGCMITTAKEDCAQTDDPNRQIGGCTIAIQSDEYSGADLALIYTGRGLAYERIGDVRRAVADYDEALKHSPDFAPAYEHRADARCRLAEPDHSIRDRMEAMRLGAFTAKDMQIVLQRAGYYRGAADGVFGPVSRRALRSWTEAGCPLRTS